MIESSNKPVLVVAPHPDDETLGAGGFLLRAHDADRPIHWLIVTKICEADGWPLEKVKRRENEIANVSEAFGFTAVHRLGFATAQLDILPLGELVGAIGSVVQKVEPEILLLPHRGDAHSDHRVVHDAAGACAKWFRYPTPRWVLSYETLSETDACVRNAEPFRADVFADITPHLEEKIRIAKMFGDEIQPFPFPRSDDAIRGLAAVRGVASGSRYAEAFMLHRARI
ncbi:PIG-L deacetylase family protein [Roseibium sp. FZY0029]|uniref:PIG-L deacetylase family protein n=1 Tax=Roseibium sp. FZY0029 TaxID=3116647 RepID=UPI002EC64547|nr:PIG-L deacetylase family protein [Roseibium sp. FZY0029]